jgi:hypothetical protein
MDTMAHAARLYRAATQAAYGVTQLPRVACYVGHSLVLRELANATREREERRGTECRLVALLYRPAARCKPKVMIWRSWSCASVSGLSNGAFELLAIVDIRARSISFASRPQRPEGPPDHERAGETFLHLLFLTRRPRLESQLLLSGSA